LGLRNYPSLLYVDNPSTEGRPRSIEFYGLTESWKESQGPYEKAENLSEDLVRRRRVKSPKVGFIKGYDSNYWLGGLVSQLRVGVWASPRW